MRQIATERADLGDASIARDLDITALYAQHASDGYELYGRYSNNQLEHVPPQLNRGILMRRRMGKSIGTDLLLGAGRCRGLIPGTCVSE